MIFKQNFVRVAVCRLALSALVLAPAAAAQDIDDALAASSAAVQTAFAHAFTRDIQVRALYTHELLKDKIASGNFCIDPRLRGVFGLTTCSGGFLGFFRNYKISIPTNFFAISAVDAIANGATPAEASDPCVGLEMLINTLLHEIHHARGIPSSQHCLIYCNEKKYYDAIIADDPKYAIGMPSRPGVEAHRRSICREVAARCPGGVCP